MNVRVLPGELAGAVVAPSSKSEAHRLLICAAFAPGTTDIACTTTSDDIDATIRCLEALGARIARTRVGFRVRPVPGTSASDNVPEPAPDALLDCGESGSTLRFLLPVVAALGRGARLAMAGRLPQRPLSPLYEELEGGGVELGPQGTSPLTVSGRLRPGRFELPGDVSSQYVSGLLMAAPLLGAPVEVVVAEPIESRPYIDLTVSALAQFGVNVSEAPCPAGDGRPARSFVVSPGGLSSPGVVSVGGDWSGAAFWLAAGALSAHGVEVSGLDLSSAQGDRQVLAALALLGARVLRGHEGAACLRDRLRGRTLSVASCPDLVPPLAAVAALAEGTTRITGAARLRLKESDRLATVSAAVNALGGRARVVGDDLVIEGVETLSGGVVDAAGDHRIAMMAAVLATRCSGPTTIVGAECVSKSYPAFFEDLSSLGGICEKEA